MTPEDPFDENDPGAGERFYTAVIIIVLIWLLVSATVLFIIRTPARPVQESAAAERLAEGEPTSFGERAVEMNRPVT